MSTAGDPNGPVPGSGDDPTVDRFRPALVAVAPGETTAPNPARAGGGAAPPPGWVPGLRPHQQPTPAAGFPAVPSPPGPGVPGPGAPRTGPPLPPPPGPWPPPPPGHRPPNPLFQDPPPPLPRDAGGVAAPLPETSAVRYGGDRPVQGWQARVYSATGGRVNPGLAPQQRARQAMIHAIRRPLREPHRVAVMSMKGGVGKTTVAACLGLVLAENRGDRVVAVDANPDAGTLADRLTGDTSVTVRDMLDNVARAHSLTDVDRFTSLAGRLQVLASEQDPAAGAALRRDEYERVCGILARFANIVVTDSGTGLVQPAMEGTLALADSLVVVGSPTVDGAGRASRTLDWLVAHGRAEQAARALVVLSCDRWSREVDRGMVRAHFAARCRGVVEIPFDPFLAVGGRVRLPALRPATIDAFLLLAARVADGFDDPASPARP